MLQNEKLTEYLIISIYIYLLMGKNKQKICHKKTMFVLSCNRIIAKGPHPKDNNSCKI